MATDKYGNIYVAYDYWDGSSGHMIIKKLGYKQSSWVFYKGWYSSGWAFTSRKMAYDAYNNYLYIAYDLYDYSNPTYRVIRIKKINLNDGSYNTTTIETDPDGTGGEYYRWPSVACDYGYQNNWAYVTYEYVKTNGEVELIIARSNDYGASFSL